MLWLLIAALAIPLGLDLYMPVPEDNPITAEKIELGRRLFSDRRLSRDSSIACISCHDPERAFSSPARISAGVSARRGRRNAPALVNRGWGRAFFWDARVSTLEEQVLQPIEDPNEMDLAVAEAAARVGLAPTEVSRALATYIRSIMSGNSPYDRFINGDRSVLSAEAQRGLELFRGKANCSACHIGPNFTDEKPHNTGIAWDTEMFLDEGRAAVSGTAADRGAFKTPTLREVERSAPYMHDGSVASLAEVIDYYDRGGNRNPFIDSELRALRLTPREKRELVSFLGALSGDVTK